MHTTASLKGLNKILEFICESRKNMDKFHRFFHPCGGT